ncbi:TonB-dependent receptor [Sphingosinicella sp. BN140058]|uniref:TonB-dependent receptor n=1 Tax=Sphingosinicella sp. BN140058 TaxID=1892855 RepID=UPI0010137CF2|nr:TonB-dependent receptor [Sphingosinicella sp. BN140058]QAY77462.1 TonB-dependent receptor [Sphingosinicella sp. BN140058]
MRYSNHALYLLGASLAGLAAPQTASAQATDSAVGSADAAPTESEPAASGAQTEETAADEGIIVTGFRSSLDKALGIKRREAGAVDTILAEDIADFPDLNLAESIQRLPGVTIDRDTGQGRTISVRGLNADFTRVRINGLEAQAAYGGNRSRGFDFSIFASELFNSITVRKTQSAEIEEGSLGATVDLQTGRPLDFGAGFHTALSGQGSYNDLSKKLLPRLAGLVSWSNPDSTLGFLLSAAYSERKPTSESFNTTRWQRGDPSAAYGTGNNFAGCVPCTTPAQRDEVLSNFYPRIPRYTYGSFAEDRLGITGAIQWRPSEQTEVTLDVLFSRFNQEAESPNIEAISFSRAAGGVRETIVRDYAIDPETQTISYGVFDDVDIRSENGFTRDESEFAQVSLNARHAFTDRLRGRIKIGGNESKARTPLSVSYMFDANNRDGFTYDFRENDRLPLINYGFDVSSGAPFTLTEWRKSEGGANYKLRTYAGALEYDLLPQVTLKGGGEYRTYAFDTFGNQQAVSTLSGADRQVGVDALGKVVSLEGGLAIPAGSSLNYIVPDIWKINDFLSIYDDPLVPTYNGIREVGEKDKGAFVQADFNTDLGGLTVRGNVGLRYARTDTTASGFLNTDYVTVKNSYEDWLPSFNLAIEPARDLVVRLGAAKVMSRPALGDLTPGGSLSTPTRRVSYGNPLLNPFRATNYDASVEWYFAREALLSAAFFYKKIDSFITTSTEVVPWASLGLPDSLLTGTPASPDEDFEVTRKLNGEGGTLKGIELQYQQPFSFLPGPLSNFGFIGNYTWVHSKVNYGTPEAPNYNRLTGQSKNMFNATLYYEDDRLSARVSAAYRDRYLVGFPGGNGNSEEGVNSTLNIDASMSYEITKTLTFSLEAVNLTDEYNDRYVDVTNRVSNYRHFGRELLVGLRWKY